MFPVRLNFAADCPDQMSGEWVGEGVSSFSVSILFRSAELAKLHNKG